MTIATSLQHAWPRAGQAAAWRAFSFGLCAASVAVLSACTTVIEEPVPQHHLRAAVAVAPPPVVSVYVEPPLVQPEPILVPWAPPPMLVQAPPPPPFEDAVWVGGYWAWEGRWVWSAGYWDRPPRPRYVWVQPYYEHRGDAVVFVNGFWGAPNVAFVPPPPTLRLTLSVVLAGARGMVPTGPQGIFVPPPPGSAMGLIVPAPLGTPPAVVTSAPAVVRGGMRVVNNNQVTVNNTVINNIHVTNVRNVTVEAPASATATRTAFNASIPAHAALAAAASPVTHWQAPLPQTQQRYALGAAPDRAPVALPPPQAVRNAPVQPHNGEHPAPAAHEHGAAPLPPAWANPVRPDGRPADRPFAAPGRDGMPPLPHEATHGASQEVMPGAPRQANPPPPREPMAAPGPFERPRGAALPAPRNPSMDGDAAQAPRSMAPSTRGGAFDPGAQPGQRPADPRPHDGTRPEMRPEMQPGARPEVRPEPQPAMRTAMPPPDHARPSVQDRSAVQQFRPGAGPAPERPSARPPAAPPVVRQAPAPRPPRAAPPKRPAAPHPAPREEEHR